MNCSFSQILAGLQLDRTEGRWAGRMADVTPQDVEGELGRAPGHYSLNRLLVLVSPAAQAYLEAMAQQAHQLTIQRFGKTISLFAPLYLSSHCCNICTYCGFSAESKTQRKRLSIGEATAEADIVAAEGFSDLLLVSGEDRHAVNTSYLIELAAGLRERFSSLSIEIQQLGQEEYARLFAAGIDGVTFYQESYDRAVYGQYHLAGPKADYDRRVRGPQEIAAAGMRRIGLGVLLGLADWREETLALAEHGAFLMKYFSRAQISFSFPRLRPAQDVESQQFQHLLGDRDLVQMMLALRLCFADAGLVLSTREPAALRDALVKLGVTKMSAGSKTNPGGYGEDISSLEQFSVDDQRCADEVAAMIRSQGFESVWKDWDAAFATAGG